MKYKVKYPPLKLALLALAMLCLGSLCTIGALNLFAKGIPERLPEWMAWFLMAFGGGGTFAVTYVMYEDFKDHIFPDASFDFEQEAINKKAQELLDEAKELGKSKKQ